MTPVTESLRPSVRDRLERGVLGLLSTVVFLCLIFVPVAGAAVVDTPGLFTFENADLQTVVKQVAALTGITFLFDPDQVKGRITLLAPTNVSAAQALELLRSALALHGYTLLPRTEGMWIVPAEQVVNEAFTIKVVPLTYARAGEVANALSWVAPPSVRIVPYYPTNSLIISGHPAAVEGLIDLIR
jgi:general secretion pathway protein D